MPIVFLWSNFFLTATKFSQKSGLLHTLAEKWHNFVTGQQADIFLQHMEYLSKNRKLGNYD